MWTDWHKFPYDWKIKDSVFTKDKWTVFSCFACGGWSTMWYKLAWFDVIGCNEIDKKMNACYVANHNPKYNYLEDIRTFKQRKDLPLELYNLDILDWSPPCSSFSMVWNREDDRWKKKKFREWQEIQELDILFFDFIDLAKELQPKIVVAENVKGLLLWEARKYVQEIYKQFDTAGYYLEHYLLKASTMWVPQARERVFFVWVRKDQERMIQQKDMFNFWPKLKLEFSETPILFQEIYDWLGRQPSDNMKIVREAREYGDWSMENGCIRLYDKKMYFSQSYIYKHKVSPTITSHECSLILFDEPKYTSQNEVCKIWSYPIDYNFLSCKPHYLIWMSVPPVMMAQIASEIYTQLLEAQHETLE